MHSFSEANGECSLRREQQWSPLEQLETIKLQGSACRLTLTCTRGVARALVHGARLGAVVGAATGDYGLWLNLKTANLLGVSVPPSTLPRADEVIE
jgi:hypothetical protein